MKKLILAAVAAAALALPVAPAAASPGTAVDDSGAARAGVTFCGATGHYIIWYYDANNQYRELWNSCI